MLSVIGERLRRQHLLAALLLALFVALLYYPLLFTNRVLASGDILLYFHPYRDYVADALRQGQIPLWNPYTFMGAPLLANPQAAVLYPLHWPLIWLPVTKQIYWSAALHTWLLGFGGYLLLRRWGGGLWGGIICGLVLAGSGFYGGLIGHLNQMNAAAWLPWGFWILECGMQNDGYSAPRTPYSVLHIVVFALLVALMLLAGHAQMAYINLFALGVWAVWPLLRSLVTGHWSLVHSTLSRPLILLASGALGGLLSAAQLLPTVELSNLGLRSGGLDYAEVTSFSLKPLHLLWTLLPSYGWFELETVFNTPAYSEYIAYVGLIGLGLAAVGAWKGQGQGRGWGLLLVGLGFLLALGRWNPLYFVLYWVVPGFDLFRNPARWMMLYTLGMALLAGVGAECLIHYRKGLGIRDWDSDVRAPNPQSLIPFLLVILVGVELLLAARALPHTQTTAPQAVTDVRTAPAHLLTDPVRQGPNPAAMGRFLGMSTITYDPGDMADWRRILLESEPPQLDQRSFEEFIIALKVQELLVPNLSLLWRLPAVDGFDGGVLPLQRYNDLLTLLIPREELVPDGRLREQLQSVPSTALLNLLQVQYLITDKVRDLWFEDVFYDRQIGATLSPDGPDSLQIAAPSPFAATHVDLIAYVDGSAEDLQALQSENTTVAELQVHGGADTLRFPLVAGGQLGATLADGALDSPLARRGGATVAYRDVEGGRQEYRVRLTLPQPTAPLSLTVRREETPFAFVIQAATLLDARTGMFTPLLPSDRGSFRLVHSGDVKIYENLEAPGRASLAYRVVGVADPEAALAALRQGEVIAGQSAVVEGMAAFHSQPGPDDEVEIVSYTSERVEIRTLTAERALLVLTDTAYPGWIATVDGAATPIYTTNYLFRGVPLPAGEHRVLFEYRPTSWRWGMSLSGLGLLIVIGLLVLPIRRIA